MYNIGALRVRLIMVSCILLIAIVISFFVLALTFQIEAITAFSSENLIRLHVIAHSNLPVDQDLKLLVRDAVLAETSQAFAEVGTKAEARAIIEDNQTEILAVAQQVILDNGFTYPVTMNMGNYMFPSIDYGSVTLPEGEYEAIQIKIGDAKGHNWWCVLFPPLCLIDPAEGDTQGQLVDVNHDTVASGIAFRVKVWDQFQETRYAEAIQKWWQASAASLTQFNIE